MSRYKYAVICCFILLLFSGCKDKEIIVEETLEVASEIVIEALEDRDMITLSEFTHPQYGVRFTPYSYIDIEIDKKVSAEEIKDLLEDDTIYTFGTYDGIGDLISYTWKEYYSEFVYNKEFKNAESISYNQLLHKGNMIDNIKEVYPNSEFVEYYFSGFNEDFGGADWQSLTIVFEKYDNKFYVVGIIHNQWTV